MTKRPHILSASVRGFQFGLAILLLQQPKIYHLICARAGSHSHNQAALCFQECIFEFWQLRLNRFKIMFGCQSGDESLGKKRSAIFLFFFGLGNA